MKFKVSRSQASLIATIAIAILLFVGASLRYSGFFSVPVFFNLIDDNAFLGVAAIGMTFVILSGGIDLSVGAMIGLTSIASALLVERAQVHPALASLVVLVGAAAFGALQGVLISRFEIAPFLVTLAGMFFLRGAAYTLSLESIALTHPAYRALESFKLTLGGGSLRSTGLFFFMMVALGLYVARHTRFGRGVYAIGGNAQSALLMGLPVKRILTSVYVVSAVTSALAGLTFSLYTSSGSATAAMGLELDVIAAVVIGGTLLTGGQGSLVGTVVGVLILGMIQTIITFEGTLSSWWSRIVIGFLLFFFVALQKLLAASWQRTRRSSHVGRSMQLPNPMKMAIPIAVLIFASFPVASASAKCPVGYDSGAKLDVGLRQITGTHLKPGDHASDDLPDPAPPYTTTKGEIEIYGSSLSYIRFDSYREFARGGCYRRLPLDLRQDNGIGYPLEYSHPWDVRKFRVLEKGKKPVEILLAGAMSRSNGRQWPVWPDDNMGRRIFIYHQGPQGQWIRKTEPMFGKAENAWIGHSYGGNLIQEGMRDPNVIRLSDPSDIAFFYERVSDDTNDSPYKTEIFAFLTRNFESRAASQPEVPIFTIPDPPYPALKRTIGGFLAEGPRPIEMKIKGKRFFIVSFSSGDFSTDQYTINYAWSKSMMGPYQPMLTADGKDLLDLGTEIKATYNMSWMGRPSIFRTRGGEHEVLFHAVRKEIRPDNDYTKWPQNLLGFYRSLFKVTLDTSIGPNGEPILKFNPHRAAR